MPPLLRNISSWDYWLKNDPDRQFIMDGITHGFSIIDPHVDPSTVPHASTVNSRSATTIYNFHKVNDQISEELAQGNYIIAPPQPRIISAISAIPKPDGGIRLVHDLSRPEECGVNYYATKDPCKYQTVDEALQLIKPGWFMAVVDLKSAYRSVHIQHAQRTLTGLSWTFPGDKEPTIMYDSRLPFGSRKAPAIFNRLTQAVRRIMTNQGHKVVAYLDDFWVCGADFQSCKAALDELICLLRALGFQINWNKIKDPSQATSFLGILINTVSGELSLKPDKLEQLIGMVRSFLQKTRATRRQLEQLAGKLSWAARVIPWGRAHLRSIFSLIATLKQPSHKGRITGIKWDLKWWATFLQNGENRRKIWLPTDTLDVYTDASLKAGGAFCHGDWLYTQWAADCPALKDHHINTKELAAVVAAACRWGHLWAGHHVIVHTDSSVTLGVINKGSARNQTCLQLLQLLARLSMQHGFVISARHIPGDDNTLADTISRLHEPNNAAMLCSMLQCLYTPYDLLCHMSERSWFSLFRMPCMGPLPT